MIESSSQTYFEGELHEQVALRVDEVLTYECCLGEDGRNNVKHLYVESRVGRAGIEVYIPFDSLFRST